MRRSVDAGAKEPVSLWCLWCLLEERSFFWCEKSGEQADTRWLWCWDGERSGLFGYSPSKGTSLNAACLKVTPVAVHLWLILAQGLLIQVWRKTLPEWWWFCYLFVDMLYAIQSLNRSKSSSVRDSRSHPLARHGSRVVTSTKKMSVQHPGNCSFLKFGVDHHGMISFVLWK